MEVPDKICVAPHQISDYDLEIQEVGHNGAEEYIRKDALMEWLEWMITKEGSIEGFIGGYDFALKEVINHLNEM